MPFSILSIENENIFCKVITPDSTKQEEYKEDLSSLIFIPDALQKIINISYKVERDCSEPSLTITMSSTNRTSVKTISLPNEIP